MSEQPTFAPRDNLADSLLALLPPGRIARQSLPRGAGVFRQGDPARAVFVVEAGQIRLTRFLADGTQLPLHVAARGESFAEASLSAASYHCDAIAETDSIVLVLPKADLLAALRTNPAQSLKLAFALAGQVRDLRAKLELRNIRSAPARVLAWLRLHASGNTGSVTMHRSWSQVADELGLTREAVYRALAQLEQQQRINRQPGMVQLSAPSEPPSNRTPRSHRRGRPRASGYL